MLGHAKSNCSSPEIQLRCFLVPARLHSRGSSERDPDDDLGNLSDWHYAAFHGHGRRRRQYDHPSIDRWDLRRWVV